MSGSSSTTRIRGSSRRVMMSLHRMSDAVSRMVNVLPRPGSLVTRRLPWFFSTIDREIASPRPKPSCLGRVERLHDPGQVLRLDPDAGVGHGELHDAVAGASRDRQPSSLGHRVARVADQVAERDPELVVVAQGVGQVRRDNRSSTSMPSPGRVDLERLAHQGLDRQSAPRRARASWRSWTAT